MPTKISELTAATSLTNADTLCVVQSGTTKKATITLLTSVGNSIAAGIGTSEPTAGFFRARTRAPTTGDVVLSARYNNLTDYPILSFATDASLIIGADQDGNGTKPTAFSFWGAASSYIRHVSNGAEVVRLGDGFISVGTAPYPATGTIRLPDLATIKHVTGGVDRPMLSAAGGDVIVGDATNVPSIINRASAQIYNQVAGDNLLTLNAAGIQFGSSSFDLGGGSRVVGWDNAATAPTTNPTAGIVLFSVVGNLRQRDPDGVVDQFGRGHFVQAMADANQTPTANQAAAGTIEATGVLTAERQLVLPTPTADSAYYRVIKCATTVAGISVKTSAGTAVSVGAGKTAIIGVIAAGAFRVTADA